MTTLKITFYKNIKSGLVLVNHHFHILGGKRGGGVEFNVWTEFFFQKQIMLFHKDINDDGDYEDECYDFQNELFNFEQILRMSRDN
jgi:hypothetical protein